MKDEQIDDLLADLDRALSVHPSPAVTARVRTRIASGREHQRLWVRGFALAAAALVIAAASLALWPGRIVEPAARMELTSSVEPVGSQIPSAGASQGVSRGPLNGRPGSKDLKREANAIGAAVARHEPEVLVSPDAGIAFEQLRDSIAAGRITAAAFSAERSDITPTMVTPTVIEIRPFDLDTQEAPGDPSGKTRSNNDEALASVVSPQTRMRSTL